MKFILPPSVAGFILPLTIMVVGLVLGILGIIHFRTDLGLGGLVIWIVGCGWLSVQALRNEKTN